ncbi:MAG: ABC transporter permease [Clostridia bacterium]
MLSRKRVLRKRGFVFLLCLWMGIVLFSLASGVRLLYAAPDIVSAWTSLSLYPFNMDRKFFSRTLPHVTAVGLMKDGNVSSRYRTVYEVDLILVDDQYADVYSPRMKQGRFFWEKDFDRNTAVLNDELAFQLFGYTDCVGERYTYKDQSYVVVGVTSDDNTRYSKSRYRMYVPYSIGENSLCDFVGVAGIPFRGNTPARLDINRFMMGRYRVFETIDIIAAKQTLWFLIKLSGIPILITAFSALAIILKERVTKDIRIIKERLQSLYLTDILPQILGWSIVYAGILTVIIYVLRKLYDQFLYDLLRLGENFSVSAVDWKGLVKLFYRIYNFLDKQVKPDELLILQDSRALIGFGIILFYLGGLAFALYGIFTGLGRKAGHLMSIRRKPYGINVFRSIPILKERLDIKKMLRK